MTNIIKDEKIIEELLSRSIKEILPSKEEFKEALLSGKQLRVYIGTDPTFNALHLGHATNYIYLEKLRKLGHKVIFLIGDYTARIGDPTGEKDTRKQLTRQDVVENVKTWLDQVKPIISFDDSNNPVEVRYNHDWYSKFSFEDVINLTSNFTIQQMIERDMFEKRINEGKPVYVHEVFYPMMQGYDSVVLDVDAELCGNDQKFNALAGRYLQKKYNNKEKFVIITTLLENPKTGEKMMSKSKGTGVFLNESPNEMFGKLMSQPDENIKQLFTDCTYLSIEEIENIINEMNSGILNPRDAKLRLAKEIVAIYHGSDKANFAMENFINVFSKKANPEDMQEIKINSEITVNVADWLVENKLIFSKSEARRLVEQGGLKINDEKFLDTKKKLELKDGMVIKIGKRKFLKIIKV